MLFLIFRSCTNTSFNSVEWKNWNNKESFVRWDMLDDLINNHHLKGKTHKEIRDLLGEPDNGFTNSSDNYYYDLGPCRRGIDFGGLSIEFKKGIVTRCEKYCS